MKKISFILAFVALLTLSGCTPSDLGDLDESLAEDIEEIFTPSPEDTGTNVIRTLGEREEGVSIGYTATNYVDSTIVNQAQGDLSRLGDTEWVTISTNIIDSSEITEIDVYGGAVKYSEEGDEYYYYRHETDEFVFATVLQDQDEVFNTINAVETLFTLNDVYFAALFLADIKGTIEYISGNKCMTFIIPGEYYGDYAQGAKITVSYSLDLRLLMKLEQTSIIFDGEIPTIEQYTLHVTDLGPAGELPNFVTE